MLASSNHDDGLQQHILPVIDLLAGQVVHGIAGQRGEYQPIQSQLCTSSSPADVASALQRCGFSDTYVADLDAIEAGQPNSASQLAIQQAGLSIWLDAGVEFTTPNARRILGLESLDSMDQLQQLMADGAAESTVFSLDLVHGQPKSNHIQQSADEILARAHQLGIRSVIVLEIAAVGTMQGPATLETCAAIRQRYPNIELISGGGVRDADDVRALVRAGCDRVLVASALHNGVIVCE